MTLTHHAAPPYQDRPLGQALNFLRVLWALNHGLATTSRDMITKFGVSGRQQVIMQVVNEFPGISAGELAKHLDPSSLTGAAPADESARAAAASARSA